MATPEGEATPMEPDPRARLMEEVAKQMDALESDYPEGFAIGRVITVIEVARPDDNVELRVRANMFPWVALGMLQGAEKIVQGMATGS